MTENKSTKRIQTVVSNENYVQLLEIAAKEGVTLSDFVRAAIEEKCKELGYDMNIVAAAWGGKRLNAGRK